MDEMDPYSVLYCSEVVPLVVDERSGAVLLKGTKMKKGQVYGSFTIKDGVFYDRHKWEPIAIEPYVSSDDEEYVYYLGDDERFEWPGNQEEMDLSKIIVFK